MYAVLVTLQKCSVGCIRPNRFDQRPFFADQQAWALQRAFADKTTRLVELMKRCEMGSRTFVPSINRTQHNRMKPLFALLVLLFTRLPITVGQPLAVLMVGTSHNYGKKPVEKFDSLIRQIATFKPDALYGEFLSAADYDALANYWNKANVERRLAYVRQTGYPAPKNPDQFIRETRRLLRKQPQLHQERMKLARVLYLNRDMANARYHLYRLDKARPQFGPDEVAAYRAILGEPDSLYTNRSSEYHNVVFPLMDALGIDELGAMDSQRHDLAWQAAWDRVDTLYRAWTDHLTDSTSTEARRFTALMNRVRTLLQAESQAEKAGQSTWFFNSPAGDEMLNIVNFYGAHRLFGATGFPQKEVEAMLAQWQNRNDDMVRNTVERARQRGAKRVVVFVGANHRKIMADGFRATPGVTVVELNSL